jgi:Fe-S-cluster-containing dehydrogenase component
MCAGCLTCVRACAEANGLPPPGVEIGPDGRTSEEQFSIVNGYEHDASDFGYVFVKRQCMHCIEPACVSACLTKAMYKTDEGPVIWRANKCMGCRYCMLSCPVDAPKFEYDSPIPRIRKCELCADRLAEGLLPACVESCPSGAITFGRRSELLDEARTRISEEPDLYQHHIFGEHELGGTSWLYLASAPFDEVGFPAGLGTTPLPRLTKEFLYGVPVLLTLMPAFLLAVSQATKRERRIAESGASHDERGAQRSRVG